MMLTISYKKSNYKSDNSDGTYNLAFKHLTKKKAKHYLEINHSIYETKGYFRPFNFTNSSYTDQLIDKDKTQPLI
jgi:hypothetical protein